MASKTTETTLEPMRRYSSISSLQHDLARCRRGGDAGFPIESTPVVQGSIGGIAARAIVGARTLTDCVGKSYLVDDAIAIPLPHPSGASAWLNDSVNRNRLGKALTHARREIERLSEDR